MPFFPRPTFGQSARNIQISLRDRPALTPQLYKPTFFERLQRRDYQKALKKIDGMRATAGSGMFPSRREAAEMEMKIGDEIWSASRFYGAGIWSEAEDAWIRGALLESGVGGQNLLTDDGVWDRVIKILLKRRVIQENQHGGAVDGDAYLINRVLGRGTRATVLKVFGLPVVFKYFDGGVTQFANPEAFCFPFLSRGDIMERELRIQEEMDRQGMAVALFLGGFDGGLVRELIEGARYGSIRIVLPLEEVIPALDSAERYAATLQSSGISGYDRNYHGNIVYRRTNGQSSGEWVMIDY